MVQNTKRSNPLTVTLIDGLLDNHCIGNGLDFFRWAEVPNFASSFLMTLPSFEKPVHTFIQSAKELIAGLFIIVETSFKVSRREGGSSSWL